MARILVTDDSLFQRKIISSMLEEAGHETILAESGEEGLDLAAAERPDAMILDLLMPGTDGFEVLRRVSAQGLDLPIIVLTADIQETTRRECEELGACAFLNKPLRREALYPVIQDIIGKKVE